MSAENQAGRAAKSGAFVYIVDDDEAMRESLEFLFESVSLPARSFASAQAFLDAYDPAMRGCILLDVRMPGMGGLDLQELLQEKGSRLPILIMTAHGAVPMAVRAMRAGALDFIEKPSNEQALLDRVHHALAVEEEGRREEAEIEPLRERLETLTPREREVMDLVVQGFLNKQVAGQLGVSPKTVEQHRARVMEKMEAGHLAELVRMAITLGVG